VLITYASEPTPGSRNEDYVLTGPSWVVVLDGATKRPDVDSGCVHQVAWVVRQLAGELAVRLAHEGDLPLPDVLAEAIKSTCEAHTSTCDLANPDSPSTTVAMLREQGTTLDWLVLADSPIVMERDGEVVVALDDRSAHLPSYTTQAVREARNSPGGFWVASTRPEAAYQAVVGTAPTRTVCRAGVFSDGSARLVERFGLTDWRGLLDLLDGQGPEALIRRTREAEVAETPQERDGRRGKQYDDSTAVLVKISS
jgi:Protein phosphatase 2C